MKDDWLSVLMCVGSIIVATYHLVQVFLIAPLALPYALFACGFFGIAIYMRGD